MKKEVKYALEALSGRLPREDKNLDWFYLLGFLELNRVAGAFLTTAEGLEMKLPPSVHRRLSAVRAEQADRVRFLRRWIEDIAYELDASGTEYVFLKGSILSHTQFAGKPVYASGERVSNDVDLPFVPTTFHRPLCPLRSKKSMHDSPSLYIEAARSKERSKHYSQ